MEITNLLKNEKLVMEFIFKWIYWNKNFRFFCSANVIEDKELFPNLPAGPLDYYRKKASFDYRKLAVILNGEELLRHQVSSKWI